MHVAQCSCGCASADTGEIPVGYVTRKNRHSDQNTVVFLLVPLPSTPAGSLPLTYFSPFLPLLECSDENPCEGLSRHATFDNFGMAFLTLFRVSTGDNWNGIMKVVFLCLL